MNPFEDKSKFNAIYESLKTYFSSMGYMFSSRDMWEKLQSFTILPVLIILFFQSKFLFEYIYLCFNSIRRQKSTTMQTINSDIANSNLIVNFNTAMAKLMAMEKTLLENMQNNADIYGSANLLLSIKKLKSIDISTDKGKRNFIYLFNNGKFRTQKEFEAFQESIEQEQYAESEDFSKDKEEVYIKRIVSAKATNALMLNPILCPSVTPIYYFLRFLVKTVNFFVKEGQFWSNRTIITYQLYHAHQEEAAITFYQDFLNFTSKYFLLFLLFLVIDYFIFGGLQIKDELKAEKELGQIYKKAGLQKPVNKTLMMHVGLYGFNLLNIWHSAKKLKD